MTLFHPLGFASTDEAAAFIAALSRALNSPERGAAAKATGSVEVWIDRGPSQSAAVVYLSDAALDAAVAAFPPVPVLTAVSKDMLPAGCRQVIAGGQHPSWGIAEVQRLLASLALCFIAMLAAPVAVGLAQTDVTLAALSVPDAKLPAGCRLQPPAPPPTRVARGDTVFVSGNPAPFFPYPTNPWVGVDRRLVVEARKRIDPFGVPDGPPPTSAELARMEFAWVANVREGYHVTYVSADNVSVDVTAIRFDDAGLVTTTRTVAGTHVPRDVSDRLILGASVVVVRSNSRTECFDAVDAYIKSMMK